MRLFSYVLFVLLPPKYNTIVDRLQEDNEFNNVILGAGSKKMELHDDKLLLLSKIKFKFLIFGL